MVQRYHTQENRARCAWKSGNLRVRTTKRNNGEHDRTSYIHKRFYEILLKHEFFYSPPRYQCGNSVFVFSERIQILLRQRQSIGCGKETCISTKLARRHEILYDRKELYELSYEELIQRAKDTASGLSSQKHAMQQLFQRT
ncbi:unnamed protein product [Clavelina lepadiformis]|uniref:Uncharacterized protein n=1 Tax=Clavelina lepadiformis TaxID=159417 RepID=A0ABP0F417_CLALP